MYEPVVNITESFFDDFIKTNADFRYKAGLRPQIIRIVKGKACEWCRNLEGIYDYGDIGKNGDVFRRHQNCHCQVICKTSKYKQDVWSKEKEVDNAKILDILYTSARIVDLYSDRVKEFANMYYPEICSFSTDCCKIAKKTGFDANILNFYS